LIQQFLGETKSQKIIDDVFHIYKEDFAKQFPNYFENNHSKLFALVSSVKDGEIKSLGMSKVDDLLTDNWGNFLGALLNGNRFAPMNDVGGSPRTPSIYSISDSLFNQTGNGAVGTSISVGNGSTPPTRADINIESSLQGIGCGDGGWNSGLGKIDIPASAVSSFTNSISEVCLFATWFQNTPAIGRFTFLLARDIISPVVAVNSGEVINVDYEMLLN